MKQLSGIVIGWLAFVGMIGLTSPAVEAGGATLTVKVTYAGTPPAPRPINFGAEQQCAAAHAGGAALYEDFVVGHGGALQWALVYVKEGVTQTYHAPTEPAVFNQAGCTFTPHVAAVRVGQPVTFHNNDAVLHNVRALSKQGQSFNIAQPTQGMQTTKTFQKPEIGIPLKCDVHFWMTAYLHVLAHPFFGVTGDDGTVVIKNLPAGTYTLEAWHEKLGARSHSVTVKDGETQTISLVFQGS